MRVKFGFGLPGPFYVTSGTRRRKPATAGDDFIHGLVAILVIVGVVWAILSMVF